MSDCYCLELAEIVIDCCLHLPQELLQHLDPELKCTAGLWGESCGAVHSHMPGEQAVSMRNVLSSPEEPLSRMIMSWAPDW